MEEFKRCFDNYEVSNLGKVRRKMLGGEYKELTCSVTNRGYKYFQLRRDGKRINFLVHQLVAKLFIGERTERDIDHIDRDKLNNNVQNLRYVPHQINMLNHHRVKPELGNLEGKERKQKYGEVYRLDNQEKLKEQKKKYYNIVVKRKALEKIKCECGMYVCNIHMNRHLKTEHIQQMKPLDESEYKCICGKKLKKTEKARHNKSQYHLNHSLMVYTANQLIQKFA